MNDFFADIVSVNTSDNTSTSVLVQRPQDHVEFDIAPLDVRKTTSLLQRVKTNTATGPDNIPAFLLNKLSNYIAPNLTLLYNSSIANGLYPADWKKANVTPIYKNKGSKSEVGNYRPISILPIVGRILEKHIGNQLQQYCDISGVIPDQQFGFRKNSSCEQLLLAAMDSWIEQVADGKLVGALLLDLSKAFDSISHEQLLQELKNIGCSRVVIRWFSSFLEGRRQRVKIMDRISSWRQVERGSPRALRSVRCSLT